eukprot:3856855-Rhodomonas_salina.1
MGHLVAEPAVPGHVGGVPKDVREMFYFEPTVNPAMEFAMVVPFCRKLNLAPGWAQKTGTPVNFVDRKNIHAGSQAERINEVMNEVALARKAFDRLACFLDQVRAKALAANRLDSDDGCGGGGGGGGSSGSGGGGGGDGGG